MIVQLPNGKTAEFPDDMPQEQIAAELAKAFPAPSFSLGQTLKNLPGDIPRLAVDIVKGTVGAAKGAYNILTDAPGSRERFMQGVDTLANTASYGIASRLPEWALKDDPAALAEREKQQASYGAVTTGVKQALQPENVLNYVQEKPAHALFDVATILRGAGKLTGIEELATAGRAIDPLAQTGKLVKFTYRNTAGRFTPMSLSVGDKAKLAEVQKVAAENGLRLSPAGIYEAAGVEQPLSSRWMESLINSLPPGKGIVSNVRQKSNVAIEKKVSSLSQKLLDMKAKFIDDHLGGTKTKDQWAAELKAARKAEEGKLSSYGGVYDADDLEKTGKALSGLEHTGELSALRNTHEKLWNATKDIQKRLNAGQVSADEMLEYRNWVNSYISGLPADKQPSVMKFLTAVESDLAGGNFTNSAVVMNSMLKSGDLAFLKEANPDAWGLFQTVRRKIQQGEASMSDMLSLRNNVWGGKRISPKGKVSSIFRELSKDQQATLGELKSAIDADLQNLAAKEGGEFAESLDRFLTLSSGKASSEPEFMTIVKNGLKQATSQVEGADGLQMDVFLPQKFDKLVPALEAQMMRKAQNATQRELVKDILNRAKAFSDEAKGVGLEMNKLKSYTAPMTDSKTGLGPIAGLMAGQQVLAGTMGKTAASWMTNPLVLPVYAGFDAVAAWSMMTPNKLFPLHRAMTTGGKPSLTLGALKSSSTTATGKYYNDWVGYENSESGKK